MFRRRRKPDESAVTNQNATSQPERQAPEQVMPLYLVCETSSVMQESGGVQLLNEAFSDLHAEIAADPLISDFIRVGVICFSNVVEEVMSLTKLSDVVAMPLLEGSGPSELNVVFDYLKTQILTDISLLKDQEFEVFRPLVLLFSLGGIDEEKSKWEMAFSSLTDKSSFRQFPNIVSIGMSGADEDVVGALGTLNAFVVNEERDSLSKAFREIFPGIRQRLWYGDFLNPNQPVPSGLRQVVPHSDSAE